MPWLGRCHYRPCCLPATSIDMWRTSDPDHAPQRGVMLVHIASYWWQASRPPASRTSMSVVLSSWLNVLPTSRRENKTRLCSRLRLTQSMCNYSLERMCGGRHGQPILVAEQGSGVTTKKRIPVC
ncbi:hypothetical protein PV11_03640 [Exophiala sideris]|uniref:Uncharacterized protein n=1 Tax=Exophiala sideris TaxID=1016849 RepID=A0A0D1X1S8_9EURO|nr:hypothetical protein PV11_03640 [Exophiala sideris]